MERSFRSEKILEKVMCTLKIQPSHEVSEDPKLTDPTKIFSSLTGPGLVPCQTHKNSETNKNNLSSLHLPNVSCQLKVRSNIRSPTLRGRFHTHDTHLWGVLPHLPLVVYETTLEESRHFGSSYFDLRPTRSGPLHPSW